MVRHSPLSPVFGLKLDHSYRRVCAQSMLPTGFKLRRCVLCICERRQARKTACFYLPPFFSDESVLWACLGKVTKLTKLNWRAPLRQITLVLANQNKGIKINFKFGGPSDRNNCRFGKWSGALDQSINMIKWVTGDVQSAFGARESAFSTPGDPRSNKWAQNEAQTWHTAGCWVVVPTARPQKTGHLWF